MYETLIDLAIDGKYPLFPYEHKMLRRIAKWTSPAPGPLDTECWLWSGTMNGGYGTLSVSREGERKVRYVHRLLYAIRYGDPPRDRVLHHKCEVTNCVNPHHLEPTTHRANIRKATFQKNDYCPQGHRYTEKNTYLDPRGSRICRRCNRERQASRRTLTARKPITTSLAWRKLSLEDRVLTRLVEEDGPLDTPCWIWTGAVCGSQYGMFKRKVGDKRKTVLVHRFMYEEVNGPIPSGTEIHHRCEIGLCANPDHLEALTHAANLRETLVQDFCKRGHPMSGENLYVAPNGSRRCWACQRESIRGATTRNVAKARARIAERRRELQLELFPET